MTTLALDTYALVNKLKEAGIPEQQAAAQIEAITKAIDSALEQAKHDYRLDELATKRDIELLRSETRMQIAESKADLIRWVVGVGLLQITIITALLLKLSGSH